MTKAEIEHIGIIFALGIPTTVMIWPMLSSNFIDIAAGFAISWGSGVILLFAVAFAQGLTKGGTGE